MPERIDHPLTVPLAVGIFGAFGASIRAILTDWFALYHLFPVGTWVINTTGSLFISLLLFHPTVRGKIHPTLFTALTVGAIGSFTTFSTVTIDAVELFSSQPWLAAFYVVGTIATSVIACFIGYAMMKERT